MTQSPKLDLITENPIRKLRQFTPGECGMIEKEGAYLLKAEVIAMLTDIEDDDFDRTMLNKINHYKQQLTSEPTL